MNADKIPRGLLIVFEGVDRAGKSTQSQLLQDYFVNQKNEEALRSAFPNRSSESGKLITQMLKGDKPLHAKASHLIFSFDRWKERDTILSTLKSGKHLIIDRYAFSGVVYSLAQNAPPDWVKIPDQGLPRPDIVFQLDIDISQTKERQDFGGELYEKEKFQQIVKEKFETFHNHRYWRRINASRSIEEIHKEIVGLVEELLTQYTRNANDEMRNNYYPDSIGEDLFMSSEI